MSNIKRLIFSLNYGFKDQSLALVTLIICCVNVKQVLNFGLECRFRF